MIYLCNSHPGKAPHVTLVTCPRCGAACIPAVQENHFLCPECGAYSLQRQDNPELRSIAICGAALIDPKSPWNDPTEEPPAEAQESELTMQPSVSDMVVGTVAVILAMAIPALAIAAWMHREALLHWMGL